MRRARGKAGPPKPCFDLGNLIVDASTRTASLRGKPLPLTTYEFALLRGLAERAGRVLDRDQLLEILHHSPEQAFDRSIDVLVSRLRAKLEKDPRNPRMLKTIRGVGYMLIADDP